MTARCVESWLANVLVALSVLTQATRVESQEIVDSWRYTMSQPGEGWQRTSFDATDWREGNGGFGTYGTPGARVGTTWGTKNIWLRKGFQLGQLPEKPALLVHHDEQAKVFLNGELVATLKGFTQDYFVVPIPRAKRDSLKIGANLMAVHCSQTVGGQFIDVHLIDAENLPAFPPTKRFFQPVAAKATKPFSDSALVQQESDRRPGPVMDPQTILAGLKTHDRALYIKAGWIRDPYITLGPDGDYYLTGTQPNEGDPREAKDPYNIGLGVDSIVGEQVRAYRSKDLIHWESLGVIFTLDDTMQSQQGKVIRKRRIWAPEIHWMGDRWALVHCPRRQSSLALTQGKSLSGPWIHPMGDGMGERHDPSLFTDDDGTV